MEIRQFMKTEVASLPTTATIGEAARLIVEKGIGTFALVPVLIGLGNTGYNVQPLWWALAFGAGFGGNSTLIGSTANIIVASMSERTDHPITARSWLGVGVPVPVATCTVASILYALAFKFFPWFGG